jgi:hypothetical protein
MPRRARLVALHGVVQETSRTLRASLTSRLMASTRLDITAASTDPR